MTELFWQKIASIFGPQLIKSNYNAICKWLDVVKCKKIGLTAPSEYNDVINLLDHLFLFESKNGEKHYISNTYCTEQEINNLLKKYNLDEKATILGTGFWNGKTIAVLFDYNAIKEIENLVTDNKGWEIQL